MDTSYPYLPSHYPNASSIDYNPRLSSTPKSERNDRNSLLLTTEPKDLDKLFNRNSYQQTAEQDICFPSCKPDEKIDKKRKTQSYSCHKMELSSTTTSTMNNSPLRGSISSDEGINLDALSLFHDIKRPNQSQTYTSYRQDDELHIESLEVNNNKLLNLYGDNKSLNFSLSEFQDVGYKDMRVTYFHPDTGFIKGKSLIDLELPNQLTLENLLLKENYWIDITFPTNEEMKVISKVFNIHPLTTEDIISHEIREKCDIFRHYMFVCYRAFLHDTQQLLKPVTFYNIVTKNYILTFHFGHVPHVQNVQQRVRQLQNYIEIVPDWINYAVMDEITDSFAPMIQQIESEVDVIDDLVLLYKTDQSDMILRIGTCRKRVIQMVRLLSTKVEVVRGLIKRITEEKTFDFNDGTIQDKIFPDVVLYLGDVQDHILTMLQNLNHYETVLTRSESNYLARISIELTQISNSTNHVIGRLTIFATVLLPMNLVTGLWGMNVKVPGKDYDNLMYFFWIVVSLIVFAILSLTFAKKIKLI